MVALGITALMAAGASAADEWRVVMPQPGARSFSNLRIELCQRWPTGFGYQPALIRASNIRPVAQDRTLEITLTTIGGNAYRNGREVRQHFTTTMVVDAATSTGTAELLMSRDADVRFMHVEVREEGETLEDLDSTTVYSGRSPYSGPVYYGGGVAWGTSQGVNPAILVVDRAATRIFADGRGGNEANVEGGLAAPRDLRRLAPLLSRDSSDRYGSAFGANAGPFTTASDTLLRTLPSIDVRRPEELPTTWLAYQSLDFVVCGWDDLDGIARSNPEAWRAIRDAVVGGLNLIVTDLGRDYVRLEQLEAWLTISEAGAEADGEQRAGGAASGLDVRLDLSDWDVPRAELHGVSQSIMSEYGVAGMRHQDVAQRGHELWIIFNAEHQRRAESSGSGTASPSAWDTLRWMPREIPFQMRPLGLGWVVALAEPDLYSQQDPAWDWLLRQIGPSHFLWPSRHGFIPEVGTDVYWDFLVPGVGAAPVKSYLGMITVFAILIGPVNYWLLRRAGRLSLLLVTVPLGAALVSLSLLVYAVTADGLGTKVHSRSYTVLDAENGMATSWSRQSYYAGLAPAGGLNFSDRTAVTPMFGESVYERLRINTRTRWTAGTQRLEQGYLPARTMRQFVVVHTDSSDARLVLGSDGLSVRNQLGVPVRYLLSRAEDGTFLWAENLEPDAEVRLEPCDEVEKRQELMAYYASVQPQAPASMIPGSARSISVATPSGVYQSSIDATFYESLMEKALRELTTRWSELPSGSYWAVGTQRPPTVPVGVRRANESGGLHVIRGTWQ